MSTILFDRFSGYLRAEGSSSSEKSQPDRPAVTISREEGAGGMQVIEHLTTLLEEHFKGPWAIVDSDLTEQVLKDQNLPESVRAFMAEDSAPKFKDALETVLGLHPPTETLVRHTATTIVKLAQMGHAIIVGRGSNFVTAGFRNVLHVRLIAPVPLRIARLAERLGTTMEEARHHLEQEDGRRARYVRQNYSADIHSPLAYDLVLNTGKLTYHDAAELIANAVVRLKAGIKKEPGLPIPISALS